MPGALPFLPAIAGVAGQIFGNKGQGASQTQQQGMSPQAQQLQNERLQAGRNFVNQPFQQFQGPRTAQFGPGFNQAAGQASQVDPRVMQALGGQLGNLGMGSQFFGNLLGQQGPGGPQFNAENIARFSNPEIEANIAASDARAQRIGEQGLNTIGDQFTQQGAFGGSRQGIAEGTFAATNARNAAEAATGIRTRGFEDAAQRLAGQQGRFDQFQGQQLGAAGNLANLGFGATQQMQNFLNQAAQSGMDVGQLRQQLGQFGIGQEREKFGEQRQHDLQNLAVQQSLAGGLGSQGTQTTTNIPAPGDPISQIGGLFTQGLGDFFGNRGQQQFIPQNVANNFFPQFNPAGGNLGFGGRP